MPTLVSYACAAIAALCLSGWASGTAVLTSVFADAPPMVPLTACMTLAGSCSLWFQALGAGRKPGAALAVLLVAAASMILLAHVLRWFGVYSPAGSGAWSLSSPLTATMFIGLGISLWTIGTTRLVTHGQWLSLGVLSVAWLTTAGYLFHGTFLYRFLPGTGTSTLSILVLILLSIGCLAARSSEGIMAAMSGPAANAAIARRLLACAVALPILLGVLIVLVVRLELIDADIAIALFAWGISVLIVAVTWLGALRMHRVDLARRQAEDTLQQAMLALQEADAHKDHFLAVLAHELRNPLAPIRSAADLLRMADGASPVQQRAGEIIARQVEHMTHLVEDLLDMSRVREGQLVVDRKPVDLHQVMHDAIEQTRSRFAERRHQLRTELTPLPLTVRGDQKRLVQIVTNLLVNAAKYTPHEGSIVLALRAKQGGAEISVRDNGIGMDAALLAQVFQLFTQARRTAGRSESGLGIGLALVKTLVELHGGTVTAHSDGPGQGSLFVVSLPLQESSLAGAALAEHQPHP